MTRLAADKGFTLLEIVIVMLIVSILSMVSVLLYNSYVSRAQGSDIVVKYDAIRTGVASALAQEQGANCIELAKRLGDANLQDQYAQLTYGYEAVTGGYRPVLTVCATAEKNGATGVKVARGAHDTLAKHGRVEKGAVLTDTLVSFALPLTDSANAVCEGQRLTSQAQSACKIPTSYPPGGKAIKFPDGKEFCVSTCPAGTVRDTANPLHCVPAAKPAAVVPAQPAGPPVPSGMKAGTSPLAPWVPANAAPIQIAAGDGGVLNMRGYASYLKAQSPDSSAPVRVVGLRIEGATVNMYGGPDGEAGVTFNAPGTGRVRGWVTVDNGHARTKSRSTTPASSRNFRIRPPRQRRIHR